MTTVYGSPARFEVPAPLVTDEERPFAPLDAFTDEDMEHTSLVDLYTRSCVVAGCKTNQAIMTQLTAVVSAKESRRSVRILDASGAYLGNRGTAALIPLVQALPRLTHLLLPRVGMKADVALALIRMLRTHPSIREINLSNNDLGCEVGKRLLELLTVHPRIYGLQLDETLVIPALKRKIDQQLQRNLAMKEQFEERLIPEDHETLQELVAAKALREEEERERQLRAEALRLEIADRMLPWMGAALWELRSVLWRHRNFLENVASVFPPHPNSNAAGGHATGASLAATRTCDTAGFLRGLMILGIQCFTPQRVAMASEKHMAIPQATEIVKVRAAEFADLFHAWDRQGDVIYVHVILSALRVHACLVQSVISTRPSFAVADAISDRESLVSVVRRGEFLGKSLNRSVLDEGPQTSPPLDGTSTMTSSRSSSSRWELQQALDRVFDSRTTLYQTIAEQDRDATGMISLGELATGVHAILTGSSMQIALRIVSAVYALVGTPEEQQFAYQRLQKDVLQNWNGWDQVAVEVRTKPLAYLAFFSSLSLSDADDGGLDPLGDVDAWTHVKRSDITAFTC